jgi:hypothetical protein
MHHSLTRIQALISAAACHAEHLIHHKHVELSTAGIIYLGTPHQGSDSAGLLKMLLDMMSLFASSTSRVVTDMKPLTDFLLIQQQQYRPISDQYLTYYCYETEPTMLPGGSATVIVPTASAVPPSATEAQRIEMTTDHIGIAKFESIGDGNFQRLVLAVKAIAADSRRRCQERLRKFKGERLPRCQIC